MRQGYFLIEISICLVLIIIISSLALPNLNFLNQELIVTELEKLHMTFTYLQQVAVSSNKKQELKIFPPKAYSYGDHTEQLSSNIEFGLNGHTQGPPSSQDKEVNSVTFKNSAVNFYPDGKIQPGTIYLTDRSKTYLYALTVPVGQISFIRKYKNKNGKWVLL